MYKMKKIIFTLMCVIMAIVSNAQDLNSKGDNILGNYLSIKDGSKSKIKISKEADGTYTANIKYVTSTDNGNTWSDAVTVASSTVSDQETYGGMWEPTIYRIDGKLCIYYSSDTVKEKANQVSINVGNAAQSYDSTFPYVESKAYQNIVMQTLDESTGLWSGASAVIDGKANRVYSATWAGYASRPGMQSVTQLGDGTYVMAVETNKHVFANYYGGTRYPFVIDLFFSRDGVSWTGCTTVGIAPEADYYCAAPWVVTLPDGRIAVSYQTDEHRDEPLTDNTNSHTKHQMKVLVSKAPVTYETRASVKPSSFDSYKPLDSVNTGDITYNAWNSLYVDGYKLHAVGRVTSSDPDNVPSKGVCIATFDSAPDAADIPAGYKPIYTADDMLRLMHQQGGFMWSGKYILMADIDMADATLDLPQQPIGKTNKTGCYFSGTFDGNYCTVSGVDIESDEQWTGLFGYCLNSTIKDLTVYGSIRSTYADAKARNGGACGLIGHINGKSTVSKVYNFADITAVGTAGGIVGYVIRNGTTEGVVAIENCRNHGSITSTPATNDAAATGGIVGCANSVSFDIEIIGCNNYGYISGRRYVGGIVGGTNHEGTKEVYTCIDQCTNEGTVTTKTTDIGGIVGMGWYVKVADCLNRGAVENTRTSSGGTQSGGIAGRTHLAATLENCVNLAPVYSRGGAICGQAATDDASSITNCYYSEIYATDVTTLGKKLTQTEAALPSSYAGIDFDIKWNMTYGTPTLNSAGSYVYSDSTYTELSTPEDILSLMNAEGPFTGKYVLTCDIDLSEYEGTLTQKPIGLAVADAFKGTFEGNGCTISGIDITTDDKAGFFGYAINATIRNLNLEGSVSSTTSYTALMCGVVNGITTIDNCTVRGTVSGAECTGGFVGFALLNAGAGNHLRIAGSTSYADILSTSTKTGGIIGYVQLQKAGASAVISGCINRGDITSTHNGQAYAGGIVGLIRNCNNAKDTFGEGVSIVGCSNFGDVSGIQRIAGIIPAVLDDKTAKCRVSNCQNFGHILAEGKGGDTLTDVGGVVAVAINLNVDACLNYGRVEAKTGKICASVVGRLYNYDTYAAAEIRNCYDLSGQGLAVVGDPDNMVCDNYKLTYCKTFTQNISMPSKYQGFDTPLWAFGDNGAYLANSHDECSLIYKVTAEPSYTADGAYKYWCPVCGEEGECGILPKLELVWGDVNADGVFSNADVATLIRVLSGYEVEYLAQNADATADGKINNRDAIALIAKLG